MFCQKCGSEVKQGQRVCPKCGKTVTGERISGLIEKGLSSRKIKMAALAVVLVFVIFGGIKLLTKSTEKSIVGTWVCTTDEEWTLTFKENGTFYDSISYFLYYTNVGNWEIPSDGILYFNSDGDEDTFEFELKGNILTIYVTDSVYPSYSFQRSK